MPREDVPAVIEAVLDTAEAANRTLYVNAGEESIAEALDQALAA